MKHQKHAPKGSPQAPHRDIRRWLGLLGLLWACATPKVSPTDPAVGAAIVPIPSNPTSTPMKASDPVMIGRQIIDPSTGERLNEITAAPANEFALPAETEGQYWVSDTLIDAKTQRVLRVQQQEFRIEQDKTLLRLTESGEPLWSTTFKERLGSLRPPEIVADDTHVFAAVSSGIAVVDKSTGALLKTLPGPQDHLALFGPLLVAVDCTSPGARPARWLVAYLRDTGAEAFRVALPTEEEPSTPVVVEGNLLVRGDKYSLLIGPKGEERLRLTERISQLKGMGSRWLITSDKRIFALEKDGKTSWTLKPFGENFVHETHLLSLPDGDWLLYNFGAISDSGVELVRIDSNGQERWRTLAKPAGVDHSEYYHQAYVALRGDALVVVSQGSYANFIEIIDAKSGETKQRFQPI